MLFWQPGRNLWFGVRLPWTLADAAIWKKSWRLASRLLMVMGITVPHLLAGLLDFHASTLVAAAACLYTETAGTDLPWKYHGWSLSLGRPAAGHCGRQLRCRHAGRHFEAAGNGNAGAPSPAANPPH